MSFEGKTLFLSSLTLKDFYDFRERHPQIVNYENANIYAYTINEIGYLKFDKYIKGELDCNGDFKSIDLTKVNLPLDTPLLKFMVATDKKFSIEVEKSITEEEEIHIKLLELHRYMLNS